MNRGFISLGIAIAIIATAAVTAGGSYAVYKVNELEKENEKLSQTLEKIDEKEFKEDTATSTESQDESATSTATSSDTEIESDATDDESKTEPVVRTVTEYVPVPVSEPVTKQAEDEPKPSTETSAEDKKPNDSEAENLEIFNIQTDESGDSTHITWQTNIESDSRIVINDDFYVSDFADSKEHLVVFSDLPRSSVINYEIVATAGSLESNKFGKFSTGPGELGVRFAYSKDEECFVVIVEDEDGNEQAGVPLEISGATYPSNGMRFLSDTVVRTTTTWGEVEYCDDIEEIKVKNTETGEVYYDGTLPLLM